MGTLIDDEQRAFMEPLLSPLKPRREKYPGRRPVPSRAARYPVCVQDLDTLVRPVVQVEIGFEPDLLAALGRLTKGWPVGPAARVATCEVTRGRPASSSVEPLGWTKKLA